MDTIYTYIVCAKKATGSVFVGKSSTYWTANNIAQMEEEIRNNPAEMLGLPLEYIKLSFEVSK